MHVESRRGTFIFSSYIWIPALKWTLPVRIASIILNACSFVFFLIFYKEEPVGDRRWIAATAWIHWLDGHIRSSPTLSEVDHGIPTAWSYWGNWQLKVGPLVRFLSASLWFLSRAGKQASAGDVQSRILRGWPPPAACSYPLTNSVSLRGGCRCRWRLPVVVTLDQHSKRFWATSEKCVFREVVILSIWTKSQISTSLTEQKCSGAAWLRYEHFFLIAWDYLGEVHTPWSSSCVSTPSFIPSWWIAQLEKQCTLGDSWFVFTAQRAVGARCKYCLNNLSRWIPLGSAFPRAAFAPEHQDIGCCGLSAVHGRRKKKDKIPRSHRCCKFWVYDIGNILVLCRDCVATPTHPGSPSTES